MAKYLRAVCVTNQKSICWVRNFDELFVTKNNEVEEKMLNTLLRIIGTLQVFQYNLLAASIVFVRLSVNMNIGKLGTVYLSLFGAPI